MSQDRGSVTIWILGLVMVMIGIGGLVIDLWRVLDEKHAIEVVADAAAAAGAGVIDEARYRQTGDVVLEPVGARDRAAVVISAAGAEAGAAVEADENRVWVVLTRGVDLGLLGFLLPGEGAVLVRGRATGYPRLYP